MAVTTNEILRVCCWLSSVVLIASQGDKYLLATRGIVQIWGHEYVKRSQTGLATTATRPRTWIDYDVFIPEGRLIRFYAYVNEIDNQTTNSAVRFQIWNAINQTEYRLLYEQRVQAPNVEALWTVNVTADVYITSYARLGWTSESSIVPISFDFVDSFSLYYRPINNLSEFPVVGGLYDFQPQPYPAVFSVAVEIDPRIVGPTGATGPAGPGAGQPGNIGPPGPPGPAGPPGYSTGNDVIYDPAACVNSTQSTQPGGCSQAQCTNPVGTKTCSCFPGFVLDTTGKICTDINECSVSNGGCDANCTNTIGSFYCTCSVGYRIAPNNLDCADIDECLIVKCRQVCINTIGSYWCLEVAAVSPNYQAAAAEVNSQGSSSLNNISISFTIGLFIWVAVLTVIVLLIAAVLFRRRYLERLRSKSAFDDLDLSCDTISRCNVEAVSVSEAHVSVSEAHGNQKIQKN